jgi:hypothetical protein
VLKQNKERKMSQEKLEQATNLWVRLLETEGVPRMIEEAVCIDMDLVGEIILHCIPKGIYE